MVDFACTFTIFGCVAITLVAGQSSPGHLRGASNHHLAKEVKNESLIKEEVDNKEIVESFEVGHAAILHEFENVQARYKLKLGVTCDIGYMPITSSWEECYIAAESLGYSGDLIAHVSFPVSSTNWPQGCYQSGLHGRFHFNTGSGGNALDGDSILCELENVQAPYKLKLGVTCDIGYMPITSSWEECKMAAESLGYSGDSIAHVSFPVSSTNWPQGCYQSGLNGRFHFNTGSGGNALDGDSILCGKHACSDGSVWVPAFDGAHGHHGTCQPATWIVAAGGESCSVACASWNAAATCTEQLWAGVSTPAGIERVATVVGKSCASINLENTSASTANWRPYICEDADCCGDGSCDGRCEYTTSTVAPRCDVAIHPHGKRICPCTVPTHETIICPFFATMIAAGALETKHTYTREELQEFARRAGVNEMDSELHVEDNFVNIPTGKIDLFNMEGNPNEHQTSTGINDCVSPYPSQVGDTPLRCHFDEVVGQTKCGPTARCEKRSRQAFDFFFELADENKDGILTGLELAQAEKLFNAFILRPSSLANELADVNDGSQLNSGSGGEIFGAIRPAFTLLAEVFGETCDTISKGNLETVLLENRIPTGYSFPSTRMCPSQLTAVYANHSGHAIKGNSLTCALPGGPPATRLNYLNVQMCEAVCSKCAGCKAFVDNYQETPPHCVFKSSTETMYARIGKDAHVRHQHQA